MGLRRGLVAAALTAMIGCQSPVPVTPVPTAAPAPVPTSAPVTTTAPVPTAPPLGTSRVETLNAANAAFRSGDVKSAAGLYDRVVNTPPGQSETPEATAAINDFARFRAMVALLADGREDEARANLDALQKQDPNAGLVRLGSQLYDQYGMTGELRGACAQLQPQVASQAASVLATLQGLGITVDGQTLCSVSQA